MGAPLPITWILSVAIGCSVSWAGGKYVYKDVNGVVKELTDEEIERLLKNTDDVFEGTRGVDPPKYPDDVLGGNTPTKPNQVHHYATDKSKTYTQAFKDNPDMLYSNYWKGLKK